MPKYAKDFGEPWRSVHAPPSIHDKPPDFDCFPEEIRGEARARWENMVASSPYLIMGSRMMPGAWSQHWDGTFTYNNTEGVIAVRRWLYTPEKFPTHGEVADRICRCVNAMRRVEDPERGVAAIRAVMLKLQHCHTVEDLDALKLEALRAWGLFEEKELQPEPTW